MNLSNTCFVALVAACLSFSGRAYADGAVYAMTNALGNNQVLVYHRAANGQLNPSTPVQTISTGGGGSGLQLADTDALGSSGGLQLDSDHHFLFAVNTETADENNGIGAYHSDCRQGSITSFRVTKDGTLTFADRISSGGLYPNSLAVRSKNEGRDDQQSIYVLNAGGPGNCGVEPNVTGFAVSPTGHLRELHSQRAIDPGPATGTGVTCPPAGFMPSADFQCGLNPPSFPRSPGQVHFTPDGDQLVVTVKGTSSIYVFPVEDNTRLGPPAIAQASGPGLPTFFGFTFDRHGHLLVTEAFGTATAIPAPGAGAVSSFDIGENGQITTLSAHVADFETAACWIAIDPRTGAYAWVANNLSNNISSYSVDATGHVTLLAAAAGAAKGANDMATAQDGGSAFLYTLAAGDGTVAAFRIGANGALTPLVGGTGLPVGRGAQGLAAF